MRSKKAELRREEHLVSAGHRFFRDLERLYYFNAVLWAYYNDPRITNGTSATTFSPNQTCSRAQIITFLWNALGRPEPTISNPYSDVTPTKYYYRPALWAYENGIEKGSGGKFRPNTDCTRAAIVSYLYRYYTGYDLA